MSSRGAERIVILSDNNMTVFFVVITLEFTIYLSYEETEELKVQKK